MRDVIVDCRVQNVYRDGCKKRMKKQLDIMGKPHDDNELEEMIRTDNPNVFNQQVNNSRR